MYMLVDAHSNFTISRSDKFILKKLKIQSTPFLPTLHIYIYIYSLQIYCTPVHTEIITGLKKYAKLKENNTIV